ncbi:MAG: flagellar hook capping FlgD N-terminal domain-containing protein [Paracoccaceae bacterium]
METYLPTGAPAGTVKTSSSETTVTSDYETFLLMMTTQIQNQDPLDPMDSNEFAVQLATFSSVEQQVLTNELLYGLNSTLALTGMADMVGWIGNEVRVAAPVHLDGESTLTLSPNPASVADQAVLVVTDLDGVEVARQDIPVSTADYVWTPVDAEGNPLPEGIYNLSLESYSDGVLLGETEVEHYSLVQEVRASPSGATVVFEGGIEVPVIYVTAVRTPTDGTAIVVPPVEVPPLDVPPDEVPLDEVPLDEVPPELAA